MIKKVNDDLKSQIHLYGINSTSGTNKVTPTQGPLGAEGCPGYPPASYQ